MNVSAHTTVGRVRGVKVGNRESEGHRGSYQAILLTPWYRWKRWYLQRDLIIEASENSWLKEGRQHLYRSTFPCLMVGTDHGWPSDCGVGGRAECTEE